MLFQSASPSGPALDGVAVVSAIVAAPDPEAASRDLLELVRSSPSYQSTVKDRAAAAALTDVKKLVELVPGVIKAVAEASPLSHNMTNLVSPPPPPNMYLPIRRQQDS